MKDTGWVAVIEGVMVVVKVAVLVKGGVAVMVRVVVWEMGKAMVGTGFGAKGRGARWHPQKPAKTKTKQINKEYRILKNRLRETIHRPSII